MIKLVVPSLKDMWFREQLINDEKTMEFNKKWGVQFTFQKINGKVGMITG